MQTAHLFSTSAIILTTKFSKYAGTEKKIEKRPNPIDPVSFR